MISNKKMKNIARICLTSSFFLFALLPITAIIAQTQTSPTTSGMSGISWICGTTVAVDNQGNPIPGAPPLYGNCTFSDLISAVKGISNFVVVNIALPFSVIIIIWAGFLYLRSGGNPGERAKANKMFVSLAWGIFWVLGAWLVVNLIITTLGTSSIPQYLK